MKILAVGALMLVAVSATSTQLRAGVQINDVIKLTKAPVGHPGGIFIVDDLSQPSLPDFPTFCAELEEGVNFTNSYKVFNIGTVSVAGGKSLTPFAAWLYDRFLGHGGGLPSFNPTSELDVNTVQFGIWKALGYTQANMEAEVGPGFYGLYNFWLNFKGWQNTFNTQVANSQWSGIGAVRIMNLRTLDGRNAQDQLLEVPEPLGVVIWALILACVWWWLELSRPTPRMMIARIMRLCQIARPG